MTASFQRYIDGQFEDGASSFGSIDPATGKVWTQMPEARSEQVNRAVASATRALSDPAWAALTASARGKLLLKLADLVEQAAPKLAEIETRDTGKIIRETSSQIWKIPRPHQATAHSSSVWRKRQARIRLRSMLASP